ncbi:GGDEF domain-containing protein [uncultured Treponema sp.]|uniref:GGDEF domain-containing protein n=1 Tax=uncultured Treponema sp. TaxID=162155 RepID=UPI0025F6083C|nr:GGDEF domain-containing protein [uncultured Treponema sp.]
MDFQTLVDAQGMAAAVLSVEKTDDGYYGDIRIVRANEMYKQIMGEGYHDNMIYSELIPKEPNFEDFCFRCAVNKQHLHAYVDTKSMGVWTDGTYIPLSPEVDDGNICHLLFFFEFTKAPDSARMSNISTETAHLVIQTCINLRGAENFYESMDTVVGDIQKNTQAFSACIFMIDTEKRKFAPLCAKYSVENVSIDDFRPYLTDDVVFSWEETLRNRDALIIKNEHDLAELEKINPIWAKSLRDAKVQNVILVPLSQGKKMFGVLFITNFNIEKIIDLKEFVELTAFFLSSEIANNALMEKLEYLSNVDSLTGVRNRNSMNARVDQHVSKEQIVHAPFGVIFADLNGLKQCNDSGGHEEGDKLLKKAAKLLKKYFDDKEIYRSGGDEFVVIVPNCEKADFEAKVAALKAESAYGAEVCFAIGSDWSSNEADLRRCMHVADEAMYADKNEFYRMHPENRRK